MKLYGSDVSEMIECAPDELLLKRRALEIKLGPLR